MRPGRVLFPLACGPARHTLRLRAGGAIRPVAAGLHVGRGRGSPRMYGFRRTTLTGLRTAPARTEGHVVFVERQSRRMAPLDLSPLRQGGGAGSRHVAPPELLGDGDRFVRWLFKRAGLDASTYNPQTL